MSDLPNQDHDPDPAALDELQRAFADDPDPDAADEDADGDADGHRDNEADRATDAVPAVDPEVDGATDAVPAVDPEVDRATDAVPAVDPEVDGATDVVPAVDPDAEVPTPPEIVTLEETSDGPIADVADPSVDDDGPVELVIVEQEPAEAADDSAGDSAPSIIRIDGLAGSTVIDDSTPESLRDVPPTVPDDADGHDPTEREVISIGSDDPAGRDVVSIGSDDPAGGDVIAISDDELPDAVYVEGSLDADGSGTIVFIEDDDTGDVLGPESERDLRRGIEPRMRERRVAVKRAHGRRRLKRVAIVAGVVVLVVGVLAVLGSPLFAVRAGDVEVFGARYTDEDRLQEIIDDAVGTPVLRLDTDQIEADLEAIPWVDEASVESDFPHSLAIDIREREAWTTYQGPDGRFRVLDRDGRVLDVLDMYPFAYVLVIGPDAVDLEAGDFAPQGYVAASELAKNLTGAMRGRVTQIEVTADGSRLVVHLDDDSTVMFGEARDLLAKLVRLEAVLTNGQECESGRIDVSTADVTRCSVLE